jgi:hypothetical protein
MPYNSLSLFLSVSLCVSLSRARALSLSLSLSLSLTHTHTKTHTNSQHCTRCIDSEAKESHIGVECIHGSGFLECITCTVLVPITVAPPPPPRPPLARASASSSALLYMTAPSPRPGATRPGPWRGRPTAMRVGFSLADAAANSSVRVRGEGR